ncbi:hypothetical protein WMY93_000062 [Mugilogobius chulae]|uniref:Ig-like domain-containing protein n=1 Tax=Mugilogobius chulae TaxID=88201 RepID=A0AAW0PYA7_9GOBI
MESALCTLLSALVVLLCSSPECKGEDTVSQPAGDVLLTQGETVEIECSFETSDSTPYLYWYKQEGRGPPGYMMQKTRSLSKWLDTVKSPKFKENRFEVEAKDNSFHLIIQVVDVTDSAVYYCALRPTVTGNTKTLNKNLWSKDNTILQAQSSRELREEPDSLVVLLCSSPECKGEDTVSQPAGDVLLTQGETVKIKCDFQTIDNTPTLFWYKQGRGAPEYMMRKRKSTSNWYDTYKSPKFNEEKSEFEVEAEKNTVSLKIQDVDVTDSAVYYCALRPTVTGNTKTLNKNLWSKDNTILQ